MERLGEGALCQRMLAKLVHQHGLRTLLQGDRVKGNCEWRDVCGEGVPIQGVMIYDYVANAVDAEVASDQCQWPVSMRSTLQVW